MIRRLLVPLTLAVAAAGLSAQTPTPSPSPSPTPGENGEDQSGETNYDTVTYWKAELPGGTYVVAHDSINGVSSQQYILDGAARVTEVNVSTSGTLQPRFYFIEPVSIPGPAGDTATQVMSAAKVAASAVIPSDPLWAKVVKQYPVTTHAGTIEYRLETKAQLDALYTSLEQSWISGRTETYRPGGGGNKGRNRRDQDRDQERDARDAENSDSMTDGAVPGF